MWIIQEQHNVQKGRTTKCGAWKNNVMWNIEEQSCVEKGRTT